MTIHLPEDVERSIEEAVHCGHFASVDDAMTEAALRLLRELKQDQLMAASHATPDPVLDCMREDAELMDEIVADAYRHRREETWRELEL
jgi:Arc/MetJ-type ribon-helix-helix transcriptional regulator